jgi:hypothetical protein
MSENGGERRAELPEQQVLTPHGSGTQLRGEVQTRQGGAVI